MVNFESCQFEAVEFDVSQVHTRTARQRLALPNRTALKRQLNAKSDHDRLLKHTTPVECMLNVHGFTVGRGLSALQKHHSATRHRTNENQNLFTSHASFALRTD